jgi:hypothetical protein
LVAATFLLGATAAADTVAKEKEEEKVHSPPYFEERGYFNRV